MKTIAFLIAMISAFVMFMVRIVSAVLTPDTYKPVMSVIGDVFDQVVGVKYINDKKPCSALGGTA